MIPGWCVLSGVPALAAAGGLGLGPRGRRVAGAALVLALLVGAAWPDIQAARHDAQDRAARRLLRTLHRAQVAYRQQHGTYARLDELHSAGQSPVGEGGRYGGFIYRSTASRDAYTITATPSWRDGQPHTIDASGIYDRPRTSQRKRPPTPADRVAAARARTQANPRSAAAWVALSEALQSANRSAEALSAARHAARLDPRLAADTLCDALLSRAAERLQARDGRQALALLTEAAALRPRDADAFALLGDAYSLLRRQEAALQAYRKATQLGLTASRAWLGLGRIHAARGERAEAARCYLRVVDIADEVYVPDAWVQEAWSALQRLGYPRAPKAVSAR